MRGAEAVTGAEAAFLARLVREAGSGGPIVEIGTLFGDSTAVLLTNRAAGQPVLSVDSYSWSPLELPHALHREVTAARFADLVRSGELRLLAQDKDRFYETYSGPAPALVFFDAVHTYDATMRDIAWARRAGARIICGHDYSAGAHDGVRRAVDECGGVAELVGTLWRLR